MRNASPSVRYAANWTSSSNVGFWPEGTAIGKPVPDGRAEAPRGSQAYQHLTLLLLSARRIFSPRVMKRPLGIL